jgi:hypothetical protein
VAAYYTGMRRIIFSTATSPSAGMSGDAIDGDEVLLGGAKCVENCVKIIPAFIKKVPNSVFEDKPRPYFGINGLIKTNLNNSRVILN